MNNNFKELARCTWCKQPREPERFFSSPICIFCQIDCAEKHLSKLQDKLNFSPPNNGALKRNCKRCREFVWWVNLDGRDHCPPCVDAVAEIAITPVTIVGDALELDIDDIMAGMMKEEL